jgi:DNA-binding transcriptional MerR regulator
MINIDKIFEKKDADGYLKAIDEFSAIAISKEFIVQDVEISSRVFNHWVKEGIVDVTASNTRVVHTFNLVELIWLKLIKRLRDFGYPIEKLKILKDFLITPYDFGSLLKNLTKAEKVKFLKRIDKAFLKDDSEKQKLKKTVEIEFESIRENDPSLKICFMFMIITEFLLYRRDVRLLIDLNAKFVIDTGDVDNFNLENEMKQIEFDGESYLNISLISLFRSIVMDEKNIKYIKENRLLNENELHILSLLREGKAKSITIKFKNQKPNIIEVTQEQKIYAEARLSEVMLNRGYQDIIIKTENGNIAVTNITTKKKLN